MLRWLPKVGRRGCEAVVDQHPAGGKQMEVRPNRSTGNGSHALVIGGSIAGLLASRMVSTHFDRVTVVERDSSSREVVPRKGIPQASHTHIMLRRGTDILEHLF